MVIWERAEEKLSTGSIPEHWKQKDSDHQKKIHNKDM